MVQSSIVWHAKTSRSSLTAHLFRESGFGFLSWCSNIKVTPGDRLLSVTPDSGVPLCKTCLKLAKERLGIDK